MFLRTFITDRAPSILMLAWPRIIFPSRGAARIIPALLLCCFLVHFLSFGGLFLHFSVFVLCYQTMAWPFGEILSSPVGFFFVVVPGETHSNLYP